MGGWVGGNEASGEGGVVFCFMGKKDGWFVLRSFFPFAFLSIYILSFYISINSFCSGEKFTRCSINL